jgi:hypothetical protein
MGYWRQMFNTAGESTTLADMNAGTTAATGAFRVPVSGTIKKIVLFVGSEAATSLVEDVRVEITCTMWSPNTHHFAANGSGLRTATTPQHFPFEYDVNMPVDNSVDITAQYIHDSGSPVTSRIRVLGYIE